MLSLSAPFIPQFFKEQLDSVLPYTDYTFCNETEARAYSDSHDWKTQDVVEIAKKLALLPKKNTQSPRVAIVTQGTEPTVVAIGSPSGFVDVKEFKVHEISKDAINDTNGAGYVTMIVANLGAFLLTSRAVMPSPVVSALVLSAARASMTLSTWASGSPARAFRSLDLREFSFHPLPLGNAILQACG
jgi:hypothetical protein